MAFNILELEPTKVSSDLASKFILIYGQEKVGKTSFAAEIPNNLLLACEKGYNAISGIYAVDITKWSDFKLALRQLESQDAKDKFTTVTIDTADILYNYCEQYVCAQAGVTKIGEIPYGQGYAQTKKEYEDALRKLTQLGYGVIFIAHAEKTKKVDEKENEYYTLSPALNKRAAAIINPMVDIIGMINVEWDAEGNSSRWLYTRSTPIVTAGSRWKYLPPRIPFGYQELTDAIAEAIKQEAGRTGTEIVEKKEDTSEPLQYAAIRQEAERLWKELVTKDQANAEIILAKAEEIFGHPVRLSEITAGQVEPYYELVCEMRELAK